VTLVQDHVHLAQDQDCSIVIRTPSMLDSTGQGSALDFIRATVRLPSARCTPTVAIDMIANPHDAMFKAVLGQPEHARGMLRAIVPPALAESLDWSTLTRPLPVRASVLAADRWLDGAPPASLPGPDLGALAR
jgi:Putative transposase, YhgA-like